MITYPLYILFSLVLYILLALYLWIQLYREKEEYAQYQHYSPLEDHIAIGGTIYNCEPYIDDVFKNIQRISKLFHKCSVVIAIDKGTDKSLEKLKKWQEKWSKTTQIQLFISEGEKMGTPRTESLTYARNRVLSKLREIHDIQPFKHFIIMDCDDVCSRPIRLKGIQHALENPDKWDSVSFLNGGPFHHENSNQAEHYYDFWALSLEPLVLSCWHFKDPFQIIEQMKQLIHQHIQQSKDKWIPCHSAFNGLAIYKNSFLKYNYDWNMKKVVSFIPKDMYKTNIQQAHSEFDINRQEDDCEHRYFHFSAVFKDKARLFIIPERIF